ncbi:MAG TPA: hypothetical protein VNZ22_08265 [Bacillota bacterium]|nr:hypothetical protein [Bacillota bacterium]
MPYHEHILLAEGDAQFAFVIQLALIRARIANPVHAVSSCPELVRYLSGEDLYADRKAYPLPGGLILGAGVACLHGLKVLRWIRQRSQFQHLRVLFLFGPEFAGQVQAARQLEAECYPLWPVDFERLVHLAEQLREQWRQPQAWGEEAA